MRPSIFRAFILLGHKSGHTIQSYDIISTKHGGSLRITLLPRRYFSHREEQSHCWLTLYIYFYFSLFYKPPIVMFSLLSSFTAWAVAMCEFPQCGINEVLSYFQSNCLKKVELAHFYQFSVIGIHFRIISVDIFTNFWRYSLVSWQFYSLLHHHHIKRARLYV